MSTHNMRLKYNITNSTSNLHFHCEIYGRSEAAEVGRNCCNLASPCGQYKIVLSTYLRNLAGLWPAVFNVISSKYPVNTLASGDDSFPLQFPLSADIIYPKIVYTWFLNKCLINPSRLRPGKLSGLRKRDPY
jgi:hypothetical protein